VPDKYRSGCSQPSIGLSTGSPIEELEKVPKIQFKDHMKLKRKEDHSVDTLVLLRRGIKIPMGGDTERDKV
jgi:hypothetical protein